MSIHKTKSGTYRVRWREEGKLQSKNFRRKVDADQFEAKLTLGVELPKTERDLKVSVLTFQQFSETWLRDYGQVHKTEPSLIRDRQIIRDYLAPNWGKTPLDQISRRDFIELQGRLKSEGRLSPKSINNIVGLAQKIFKDALQWDYIRGNPSFGLKPIRIAEQDFRFWTFEERDRFLSWAKANDQELYRIVAIAVNTGLRRGELEGLLRDCLDFDRKLIIVKRNYCHKTKKLNEYTKGKKVRRVPMNTLVFSLLKERSLITPLSQVLPFDYQHIVPVRFQPAQNKAGLSTITFHDLRHTFASHMAMSGASLFDIKELLGHSDMKTTMRYMHLAPEHLNGVTEILLGAESGRLGPVLIVRPHNDRWFHCHSHS